GDEPFLDDAGAHEELSAGDLVVVSPLWSVAMWWPGPRASGKLRPSCSCRRSVMRPCRALLTSCLLLVVGGRTLSQEWTRFRDQRSDAPGPLDRKGSPLEGSAPGRGALVAGPLGRTPLHHQRPAGNRQACPSVPAWRGRPAPVVSRVRGRASLHSSGQQLR